jgi:hypothetical protein
MKITLYLIALLVPVALAAQQPQPAPPNAPVELPEVLVTGKELIDVGAGSKQAPARPPILSSTRLDTLNPTEKLPVPRIPARTLPTLRRPFAMFPGYVDASMGTLLTPSVAAGYSFESSGYRIDLDADVEASQGWVEHAGYLTSGLKLRSTYLAPDQFIVFGGSTTHVNADASYGAYNLFARNDAAERQRFRAGARLDVDGAFEDLEYAAAVGYDAVSLATTGFETATGNALQGSMEIDQRGTGLLLGLDANLQLRQYIGNAYPFAQFRARGALNEGNVRIRAMVGPQLASSTMADERFGLGIEVLTDVRISNDVSVSASVTSGLRALSYSDLLTQNPYIDHDLVIDAPYDVVALGGTVVIHPSIRTVVSGGLRLRLTEREPVWYSSGPGLFALRYLAVRRIDAHADARFVLSSADELRIDAQFTQASVVDSAAQPYVPALTASLNHQRQWSSAITSDLGIVYIGQRWADMNERTALSGYVDLRARISYAITPKLDVALRAENILSSTIVLWDGYRERGFFASAGLTWRF